MFVIRFSNSIAVTFGEGSCTALYLLEQRVKSCGLERKDKTSRSRIIDKEK